jgi:hypothetical protein
MTDFVKSTNFASKDSLASGNPLKIVKGTEIDTEFNNIATAVATKADLNSPVFIGTPTSTTASAGTNTTQVATTAFVTAATVAERTATVTLTNKSLTSPTLTGTPVAPTAAVDNNTTQVATTAFVVAQIADDAPTKSGTGAIGNWGINVTGNAATVTTITTTQVANATAGVTAGGVGTYMLARYNSTPTIDFGVTVAGSDLTPSNATGNNVGSAVTGTWRCMGFVGTGTSANLVTLFLRIS